MRIKDCSFVVCLTSSLISTNDGTSTKATQIISNKNKELILMVPALAHGNYELQVVRQVSRGSLLKEPREEQLETTLTIE
ncbi:DUF4469 domain-containing protein [Carboxylicivirga sediminis]|uniref:DUF4469 domain-containing protein n=1 Tax=Carboxylicivirga sediminis TaxID=2006564 RepID=A0A941EZA8_9BACT|nr:DUF4469 domain-containing protein [Carboxylicivirga sediminis]MBR8533932.1 DUF4469 domain-containing protein [Carboxylicivirga sediminis]